MESLKFLVLQTVLSPLTTHVTFHGFNFLKYFPQVIAAEGEQKASRALREASEVIADSSSALQLRYLQVRIV